MPHVWRGSMIAGTIDIIPEPVSCKVTGGSIMVKERTTYFCDTSFSKVGSFLRARFQDMAALDNGGKEQGRGDDPTPP
jgi:hypothetical protein